MNPKLDGHRNGVKAPMNYCGLGSKGTMATLRYELKRRICTALNLIRTERRNADTLHKGGKTQSPQYDSSGIRQTYIFTLNAHYALLGERFLIFLQAYKSEVEWISKLEHYKIS